MAELLANENNNDDVNRSERKIGRNHALSFGHQISRKDEKIPSFHLPKLTYLEPFDYLTNMKNVPDFKKMRKREENDLLIQNTLEIPSICYYQPKYEITEKASPQISFSNEKPKLNKQYLLKKLWKSYEVEPGYHLVKLPTISETTDHKNPTHNT